MNQQKAIIFFISVLINFLARGNQFEYSSKNLIRSSHFKDTLSNNGNDYQNKKEYRRLTPSQIRINFDIGYLKASNAISSSLILQITNLFITASDFYYNLITLKEPIVGSITIPSSVTTCNTYSYSSAQKLESYSNTDLLFFVDYTQSAAIDQNFKVKSFICETDSSNNRAIIAQLSLTFKSVTSVLSDYQFSLLLKEVIHEIMHALALNIQSINYFRDSSNNLYDASIKDILNQRISYPNTLKWAQEYYGCSTLTSIPVEIASSGDIHWNRVILLDDIMSGLYTQGEGLWSGINNAILKDSGWYTVNDSIVDTQITWGKNKQCQFIDQGCTGTGYFSEFCITNKILGLTFSQNSMGYCQPFYLSTSEQYSKAPSNYITCQFMIPVSNRVCQDTDNANLTINKELVSNYNYKFGYSSRAYKSSLTPLMQLEVSQYACYTTNCSSDNSSIQITFGDFTFYCTKGGDFINPTNPFAFQGELGCPQVIQDFCTSPGPCQNFCSSAGYCLNKQCTCISGYAGDGCECTTGYEYYKGVCRQCSDTCKSCSATVPNECDSCIDGYYLLNGQCLQCGPTCLTCSSTTTTECTSCKPGLYLDSSTKICKTCSDNCGVCTSLTNCTACQDGYGFNSTNYCSIPCIYKCKKCYLYPLNCQECFSDKLLNSTSLKCVCKESQYEDQNGECQNCKLNCAQCTTIKNCQKCVDGYELRPLSQTCVEAKSSLLSISILLFFMMFIF